jgi:hypothetical protein
LALDVFPHFALRPLLLLLFAHLGGEEGGR